MVERVPLAHVALALLVTIIWGVAFVATRLALDDFSPAALTALRFLVAALPAVLLPRPRVSWRSPPPLPPPPPTRPRPCPLFPPPPRRPPRPPPAPAPP